MNYTAIDRHGSRLVCSKKWSLLQNNDSEAAASAGPPRLSVTHETMSFVKARSFVIIWELGVIFTYRSFEMKLPLRN